MKIQFVLLIILFSACSSPGLNTRRDCEKGDAKACFQYADDVHQGKIQSKQTSFHYYAEACKLGYANACNYAGWFAFKGIDIPASDVKAVEFYRKGCVELSPADPWACANYGFHLEQGLGTPINYEESVQAYTFACDHGRPHACFGLGIANDLGRGITQDVEKAQVLYEKACDEKVDGACENLGVYLLTGKGKQIDISKAIRLLTEQCEKNAAYACGTLGYAFSEGLGVKKDICASKKYAEKSCKNQQNPVGCANLGSLLIKDECGKRDLPRAIKLLTNSCSAKYSRGCGILGVMFNKGLGVQKDSQKANELFARGCQSEEAFACEKMGDIQSEDEKRMSFYVASCRLGRVKACFKATQIPKLAKTKDALDCADRYAKLNQTSRGD